MVATRTRVTHVLLVATPDLVVSIIDSRSSVFLAARSEVSRHPCSVAGRSGCISSGAVQLSVCDEVEINEDFKQKTGDKGGSVLAAEATLPFVTSPAGTAGIQTEHSCMKVKIDCKKYKWPPPRSRSSPQPSPVLLMVTLNFSVELAGTGSSGEELLFWTTFPSHVPHPPAQALPFCLELATKEQLILYRIPEHTNGCSLPLQAEYLAPIR